MDASGRKGTVLIVEDEEDILSLLAFILESDGFAVTRCGSGGSALQLLTERSFDLVILDWMLPEINGLELCRRMKKDTRHRNAKVLMLTAKVEDGDIIAGLEEGADEYVTKPFSPKVLLARVRHLLRRAEFKGIVGEAEREIRFGPISVDPSRAHASADGQPLSLTVTEFAILQFLIQKPGRVFSREQIIDSVRGTNSSVTERSVDVHVASLRRKLGPCGGLIETVRGLGYRIREA